VRSEETLHLLVLDDSSNAAETVSNMLRNAGHAVRTDRIEDDEDLREALAKHDCDMILAKPEIPYFSALEALGILKQLGKELPLLVIADGAEEEALNALLKAGARALVEIAQPVRLEHTVMREAADAGTRRQLQQCETALEEANIRAQNLVDSSRDAITYVHDGMHIFANDSYLEMFGYSDMEEIEGMPILNMVKSDEHSRFKAFLRDFDKGKIESNSIDVNGLRPDGSDFNITMEFTPASFEGEPCTQIIIRAQADSAELERKLDDMSKLDLLTGVYNRQFFLNALSSVVGKPGKQGVVLYFRPDNYKQMREEIGIAPSDQVLAEIAKLAKEQLSNEHDIIARFEGEYFTALLQDFTPEHAEAFGESLCKKIDEHIFDVGDTTATTTCTIGIGLYNEGIDNHQEVLTRAEKALQEAADMGGNRVKTYIPGEEEMAEQERMALLVKQIKIALRGNKMHLLFQPIASLKGDENENYEVFLRMQDESGNILPPKDFLPAAEKGGLMAAVDRWVLGHGIKAVTDQRRQGKPVVLFVKLSGASLKDEKLLPWLRDLLKATKAEPRSLVIEVSESVASSNLKALKLLIEGLEQLHIGLAIDHFGNAPNYANLLKHCNAQYLKLDASITGNLTSSPESQEKVSEITAMAAEENKLVVANGVEDPHTLAMIYSTGIDYIQGYFLQEPSPNMDFDFSSM
jgi:diguanylate cyclase (GGDEF)-like protein/PAS domain S-box-containing protein